MRQDPSYALSCAYLVPTIGDRVELLNQHAIMRLGEAC